MSDWGKFHQELEKLRSASDDPIAVVLACERLADESGIFTSEQILNSLKQSEHQELINASGKHSHAAYRSELYESVFKPLISAFPTGDIEYWYSCVVLALKEVGIAEPDCSYCMSCCFKDRSWVYDLSYAVLLTQLYQLHSGYKEECVRQQAEKDVEDGYQLNAFGVSIREESLA
ncbi:hypothetical protein [Bacterioplanoides sp.]|uniref:hypothetical protein n=1 Tax=Bacterioplanoides sp. TaxID=2066072 RepID=UPI003B5B54E5